MLPRRCESTAVIPAPIERVFAHIDDHARLSSHMSESSWMMGGGRMEIELDEGRGREIGSRIRLAGRVFGIRLAVEEVVTERNPPHRKFWKTTGSPRLLVIGHYRMGFDLTPERGNSVLRVLIEYALPDRAPWRWLGGVFAPYYAGWCTRRMVDDALQHFASSPSPYPRQSGTDIQRRSS